MGGHGPTIQGNENNIKEEDAALSQKIRNIEFIKHNPQLFHLEFFDFNNHFEVVGGYKTMAFAFVGGWVALTYYLGGMRTRPYNFYNNIHQGTSKFLFGSVIGGAFGYIKFGDRQRLHNAWVAERLRRRYPESMQLNVADLWRFKGVEATHEFYRWR